jgi:tRNA A37 threonylcarbamoyladenosine modification protein TsaB
VSEDTVVITDARRGEVAYSVYRASESLERIAGPLLARPETLDDDLGAHASATRVVTEEIPAAMLAKVARDFLASGREFPTPAPQYLRSPDVTMPK